MAGEISVRFFAQAREAVGRSRLRRPVAAGGVTVTDLLEGLGLEFPSLAPVLRSCRVAVNGAYVEALDARVRSGDEVAVHPPYSGG